MKDLTKAQLSKIVEKAMPGYRVAALDTSISGASDSLVDADTPGLDALSSKLARSAPRKAASTRAGGARKKARKSKSTTKKVATSDVQLVRVERKKSTGADAGPQQRVVVVSKSKQKIVGSQG